MEYQYPISHHWSTDEVIEIVQFFQAIERAYERGIDRNQLLDAYRKFKVIVPSKAEEKTICNEFEEASGYSTYRAVQKARDSSAQSTIKLK